MRRTWVVRLPFPPCPMDLQQFVRSTVLLFVLINPFLLSIYLMELLQRLDASRLRRVLLRAAVIAGGVFATVAMVGEALFTDVLQVRYSAFLLFGGAVFLLVGLRMVFSGAESLTLLRGQPEHLAGAVAMPFLIGPGTVNASILVGTKLPLLAATLSIATALAASMLGVALLKWVHDRVRERRGGLVERYVDIVGRLSALVVGSIAVDMMLQGFDLWRQP